MAMIEINSECKVFFTEEEKADLGRAVEILSNAKTEIFENGNGSEMEDEVEYFLEDACIRIQRLIDGRY